MAADEEVFEFWRLRKCLREEYNFIHQQKRGLEEEYSSIVSTGDSLFRSLWINGQQWKNLLRLKGGAKFSSECVYTSNLLDAITFVDGYVRIGFKEVKYGNFLRELKDNIALVKSILIFADQLNLQTSAFVRTMFISVYGSCLFPGDERSVLLIVKSIIEYHLVFSQTPHDIFRAQRNSFSSILDVFIQTFSSVRAFLVSSCKEVVVNILLDGSMFWTLEERELLSVMMINEVRQKFGEPGIKGTSERIRNYMKQSWEKLSSTINMILRKVKESLDCLPDILLWIVAYFYRFSLKRGLSDAQAKIMVVRFLFQQVITPLLIRPQPLLIDTEVKASAVALFNLKKVASILQTLISIEAGEDLASFSAEAKQFYKDLDRAPLNAIVDSLLEMIPTDDDDELTLSDIESMPGIARTSVLMTKTDFDSLVIFLSKLQHQNNRLLDQESLNSVLTHVEGIHLDIITKMSNLNVSEQNTDLPNELQKILHAFNKPFDANDEVLVISLGVPIVDCPGLLPEEKVLGLPTPKPKRKVFSDPQTAIVEESFDNSQQWESDSPESSSDEKQPEVNDAVIDEPDEGVVIGFEDSFVAFEPSPAQQSVTQKNLFHEFDPLSATTNPNDPFLAVVSPISAAVSSASVFPAFVSPAFVSPASVSPASVSPASVSPVSVSPVKALQTPESTTTVGVLVDVDDPGISQDQTSGHYSSGTSGIMSDNFNSSGSQSSIQSGNRFSSSASSSSEGGNRHSSQTTKDKKKERRSSLKANMQNLLKNPLHSPKTEGKKQKDESKTKKKQSKHSKKQKDVIVDASDVAAIIAAAAEQEKTAKDICDAIIHKYSDVKERRRSKSSLPKTPTKKNSDTLTRNALHDEEDIMRDAKNKLRLVFSNGSTPSFPFLDSSSWVNSKRENSSDMLLTYLKNDFADATATKDSTMVARLHETLSSLERLPQPRYVQLLKDLKKEYCERKTYISYLVRAHRGLVATRKYLEKMLERVQRDREICRRYLMTQCVSMYLDDCKEKLDSFVSNFKRISISDEKSEGMKSFLQVLKEDFQKHSLWLGSNEKQRSEANGAIERYVIGKVYLHAVYAFGETDKFRDDLFHANVDLLCKSIGEDFSALDIKEEFQLEAPWFPAQYELFTLCAYKTPTDKLKCIERCCGTVMNLLSMSSCSGAVGADAFTPVLIYVVMHANPKGLLTTVDFINSYLIEPLTGEQYYCWMQFCSAIQFIKILLEETISGQV